MVAKILKKDECMRIILLNFLLLLLVMSAIYTSDNDLCSCKNFSHSYFAVRQQFQIGSPEYTSVIRSLRNSRDDGYGIGLQTVIFGGSSTDRKRLGTYFSPVCDSSFTIDGTIQENSENLSPQHFNLFSVSGSSIFDMSLPTSVDPLTTAFSSKVILRPQQSIIGLGLVYQHAFCFWQVEHWISVSGAVTHVRNTMGLKETIKEAGEFFEVDPLAGTNLTQDLHSMEEALVQNDWEFGKIDNKKRSKTRLAFIQIQVGRVCVDTECCHFEPYIGVTIPTGNKPKAEYVFEPVVGNGDHFGILWGASGGLQVWQHSCRDIVIDFENEITMQYLFKKTHKRSVDLRNKPWSRYSEVYANASQANQAITLSNGTNAQKLQSIFLATPGINILTLDLQVKPGFNVTSNMAFVITHCPCDSGFDAELGYNFYARQAECVSVKDGFSTTAALKDQIGMGVTNPVRDMTSDLLLNEASARNLMANGQFNDAGIAAAYDAGIIQKNDLNLSSASHPCMIAHTVYGTCGYHCNGWCYPVMASIGGSYEFNRTMNSTMNRWLVWGKFGIGF